MAERKKKKQKKGSPQATRKTPKKAARKAGDKSPQKASGSASRRPAGKQAKKTSTKAAKKTSKKTSKASARKGSNKASAAQSSSGTSRKPTAKDSPGKAGQGEDAKARPAKRPPKAVKYATAESMAKSQREISVSEFFAKNRHLLGFDNPRKALLTTVREAVDNALDACEEAGICPRLIVRIEQLGETHFKVGVEDNGPGIIKKQIPNIFGKLLYGSKFHRLKMSRGQQGIGISAAGMYGLLTTGRPVRITSRTSRRAQAHFYELQIDTRKNRPDIIRDEPIEWDVDHGTKVEIEIEARYTRGKQSVDGYLEQTAIANPHVAITYCAPDGRVEEYPASVEQLPPVPREVKPHPHGVELGVLIKMLQDTPEKRVKGFLTKEFSRVSPRLAEQILEAAGLTGKTWTASVDGRDVERVYRAIQEAKILAPATDCIVPIGDQQLLAGLRQVVPAEFYTATSRKPTVYRGNPFVIEGAIAYGQPPKDADAGTKTKATPPPGNDDEGAPTARVLRFANRVPLQYQQGACAITKSVTGMNWKSYGLSQSRGSLPAGPLTIVVHMASVWVPFTSESKEAIASYPEILKEIRLVLQDCGRKLGAHVRRAVRTRQELKKRSYIQKYIPAIGEALRDILDLKEAEVDSVCDELKGILERSRKM